MKLAGGISWMSTIPQQKHCSLHQGRHQCSTSSMVEGSLKAIASSRLRMNLYMPIPARSLPNAGELSLRKISPAFFILTATGSILTIIADYRLVPGAKFPEPVEDIRDAIGWTLANVGEVLAQGTGVQGDFDNVFLMSHSAGSCHTSTLLLHPTLLPSYLRAHIRGVLLQGGVYTFKRDESTSPDAPLLQLYGSWDTVEENMPATLLQRAPADILETFPDVVIFVSEREIDGFEEDNRLLAANLEKKLGKSVPVAVMKNHNHLSPHWALWTGAGEEWAEDVTRWIKERAASV